MKEFIMYVLYFMGMFPKFWLSIMLIYACDRAFEVDAQDER